MPANAPFLSVLVRVPSVLRRTSLGGIKVVCCEAPELEIVEAESPGLCMGETGLAA